MFEAARVDDQIGHSHALAGLIGGTIVGGLLAAAGGFASRALLIAGMGASCLGVGLLLVGAALLVGWASLELGTSARDSMAQSGADSLSPEGPIVTGARDVFINDKPAAIATTSMVACGRDGPSMQMAQGSSKVIINDMPASRKGDKTNCDAQVMEGSANVIIGGEAVTTLPITPEVSENWYKASDLTLFFASLAGFGGAGAAAGKLAKLIQKMPGIGKLSRILCRGSSLLIGATAVGIVARPVEIISGQKFLSDDDELDFVLPSALPVRWQRYWRSGNPGDSVLGRGWNLFWETSLERHEEGLVWRSPEGDYISFPLVEKGHRTWCQPEKRWLEHHRDGHWTVYDISGEVWHYSALSGEGRATLTHIADPCGNRTDFEWRDDGRLQALTDSVGQRVICRYRDGRLSGAWLDDEICLAGYDYDGEGQLITVTGRGGSVLRRFGWADGLMISHEDGNGLRSDYQWQEIDSLPRVVVYSNSAGERLNFSYNFETGVRSVEREDGARAAWLVDDDDNVACYTDFDGRQTHLLYEQGELNAVLLPGGAMRKSQWDDYGRMLSETDELEHTTLYQWHRQSDRMARITGPDGASESAQWDERLRLISETDAAGAITRYHYPNAETSLPERITDPLGGEVQLRWNRQGLVTQRTDCSGSVTTFDYDRFGQLLSSTDAEGNTTRREWNAAGQLVAIELPDGSRETLRWNAHGQIERWRDALESEVRLRWNALGQPVSMTDRLNRTRRWHYDPRGNLTRLENGNGADYRFEYDPLGRPQREIRPDETSRQFSYDEAGWLSMVRHGGQPDADGEQPVEVHLYRHDAAGQLIWRAHDHAGFHYTRDELGRLIGVERRPTDAGAALGIEFDSVTLRYDKAGNLCEEAGAGGALGYDYDVLGNLSALTLPEGQQLSWLRYGSGHVSAVKFGQRLVSEFTRDRLHRELSRSQGARLQTRGYDALGRRTRQRSQLTGEVTLPEQQLLERLYRYSGRGELTSVSDTLRGELHFGYDAEGRLLKHNEPSQGLTALKFSYDDADNLLERDAMMPPQPVSNNRLGQWQNLFFRYDARGNLIQRRHGLHQQHYSYDADNRLIAASGTGPEGKFTARYRYDALGRRIAKAVTTQRGTVETRFLWEGWRLLQSREGERCATYLYDPNETWSPLARVDHPAQAQDGECYWFTADLNGAPLEATDADGAVRWSGQYGSFGEVSHQTAESWALRQGKPTINQPLRYAGQYADSETGLHYNLFRYYDPGVGRFTTQDPIGLQGGLNLYQYAPNPLGWVDPLGLYKGEGQRGLGKYHVFHEHRLGPSEYTLTDKEHFSRANESVHQRLQVDSEFKRELQTKYPGVVEHVQPMRNGKYRGSSPKGMTWHHGDTPGSLQLADFNDHKSYHKIYHPDGTGGRNKWGGGTACRK
ncbi:type IV secretion protein Rhs [Jejubacter calystegiae]|uniref:Type IV secretion protein Rhs n=1 Tax=Jejubacter calystegiae TaxID=2579935 RepID=A0A4P8YM06_9ENTR|nr:RHS repeat-associated core domain-containing protein [Jejubacter calystegiae]QCT21066.1 type IV secretion protein Rhs [Jejubacter calystegiae]